MGTVQQYWHCCLCVRDAQGNFGTIHLNFYIFFVDDGVLDIVTTTSIANNTITKF